MLHLAAVKQFCKTLGLTEVGIADTIPRPAEENPVCPLAAGQGPERYDLNAVLRGSQSAVVILFPYKLPDAPGSNLSCYCRMPDYHPVVRKYLEKVAAWLEKNFPGCRTACIADTSPLSERMLAVQAGVGILGDNGCVINPTYGSYCFVGAVLTDVPSEISVPAKEGCLHCGRCAKACLGRCFQNGGYDYHFCKSYLTQKKGELTEKEIAVIQKSPLIFGCDVCQKVCPLNKNAKDTPLTEFLTQRLNHLERENLENLTNRQFKEIYGTYAFSWRGKKILLRNLDLVQHRKNV